jgi:hydrogenase-4 component E
MVSLLVILFGATMLVVAVSSRVEVYVKMITIQGALLFLVSLADIGRLPLVAAAVMIAETLLLKTIVVPLVLTRAVRRSGLFREIEPYVAQFYSLMASTVIFSSGFLLTYWAMRLAPGVHHLAFGTALATLVNGLFIIMTRKKIMTHILGFIMCENAVFLLTLAVGGEMPLLVSLGMLLDIFIGIYLLVVFFDQIRSAFDAVDIESLSELRDD